MEARQGLSSTLSRQHAPKAETNKSTPSRFGKWSSEQQPQQQQQQQHNDQQPNTTPPPPYQPTAAQAMGQAAQAAGFGFSQEPASKPGDKRHGTDYIMSPPTAQRRTQSSDSRVDLQQRVEELYEQNDMHLEYVGRLNSLIIAVDTGCTATMGNIMNTVDAMAEEGCLLTLEVGDGGIKDKPCDLGM